MFRVVFHLDMDALYASIEQRDNPALRGQPVIVGAPPTQRWVVCAASYQARKYGVRSAMPSTTAGRLCPRGAFVRPQMDHYREESRRIMAIVGQTGAVVDQMSIDEAYLDLPAPCQAEDADGSLLRAIPLARQLKQRISSERRLTATIGVAANKLLAKIASDHQKPDGLTLVSEREKVQFLRPLPVRALYGAGRATEGILSEEGIQTVGDLQDYSGDLRALVGSFGPALRRFAVGEDDGLPARPQDRAQVCRFARQRGRCGFPPCRRCAIAASLWLGGQVPYFDIAEGDLPGVVLEEEVALDAGAEAGNVLELAVGNGGLDGIAAQFIFQDLRSVEPVFGVVALDEDA